VTGHISTLREFASHRAKIVTSAEWVAESSLWLGSIVSLTVAVAQSWLLHPLVADRSSSLAPSAAQAVQTFAWMAVITAPIRFAALSLASGAVLWAMGVILSQVITVRLAIGVAAVSVAATGVVQLIHSAFLRASYAMHSLSGALPEVTSAGIGATAPLSSLIRMAAKDPVFLIWWVALAIGARAYFRWPLRTSIFSATVLYLLGIIVSAIRMQAVLSG
jgi:hypothetical protein